MRILFVDQTGQLGGGELSLLDIVKNSTHESEVALFSDGPFRRALEDIKVPVHLLSLGRADEIRREATLASMLNGAPALFKLRNELASLSRSFDVLYANSQKALLMSALVRRKRQLLIWHLRDMLTADHFSPSMRKAAVLTGNLSASAVVVNSEATLESFVRAGGRRDKAAVVYNGIDPKPFDAALDTDAERLRQELGLKGAFVVGVFGRLSPWKGQHIAIDAVSSLPDVHIVIVGEALFGEDSYADELRSRSRRRDVEGRVHFLGFRRDIPALMKLADVVLHSSTAPEPFGRVIVEAMLAERPVIATRGGGVVEIVEDGKSGLLVAPDSSREISSAIIRLKADVLFSKMLASAGKIRALQVFSVDAMMKGIQRVLDTARNA